MEQGLGEPVHVEPDVKHSSEDGMRLLAAASHDLRQPLQAIGLWIELLQERALDGDTRRVLERVKETAHSAERVVEELLDVARLDLGAVTAQRADFAVNDLLESLASQFRPLARAKGLDLRVRRCACAVHSDPGLLERVLANFLCNAIRYTDSGAVLLGCRRRGDSIRFEVRDTGPGIPAKRRFDIFREFVQLRPAGADRRCGVGLGLSIASRIAGLLDHPVTVTSTVARGSCFAIDVPRGVLPPVAVDLAAPDDDAARAIRGAFVAYVEDDADQRDAMRDLLESWGCHAAIADSLRAADEDLATHLRTPDLLICDYRLDSGPDGLRTIEALRSRAGVHLPAILLTAEASGALAAAAAKGDVSLLRKPLPPDELRRRMAELLLRPISSAA